VLDRSAEGRREPLADGARPFLPGLPGRRFGLGDAEDPDWRDRHLLHR